MEKLTKKMSLTFCVDVEEIILQVEIYDQIWQTRHMQAEGKHGKEAVALVKEFVSRLEQISDGRVDGF